VVPVKLLSHLLRCLIAFMCMTLIPGSIFAEPSVNEAAVLVFARGDADENLAVRIERDLRQMYSFEHQRDKGIPMAVSIEPRFDVGHITKRQLSLSRSQFNAAQRALLAKDVDEVKDYLFKARRFYVRAIPYSSDSALLRGIFYYEYKAAKLAGDQKLAVDRYCAYVAIVRALAGSVGPIDQFEPLSETCGKTKHVGTCEFTLKANVDGAHVFVDNQPVGVVGKTIPYVNPFISAGPHFIEVRKAGYVRWGTLVELKSGGRKRLRAKLTPAKARVNAAEYDPLKAVVLTGTDAHSDEYLTDLLFRMTELYGVSQLQLGYLEPKGKGKLSLTLLSFDSATLAKAVYTVPNTIDGYRPALTRYWKKRFNKKLSAVDALPDAAKSAPTIFKITD